MKTFELEERRIETDFTNVLPGKLRDPKTAALLSIIPGLGQLYNGETGKGVLFLLVSLANFALALLLVFTKPVLGALDAIAKVLHLEGNFELTQSLSFIQHGQAFFCVYLLLFGSFIAYAMREAYDQAILSRHTRFAKFFLGFPEASSSSYLLHYAVMTVGLLMMIFFALPKPPVEENLEIEFEQPEPPPKPPEPRQSNPKPAAPKLEQPKKVVTPPPVVQTPVVTKTTQAPVSTDPTPMPAAPVASAPSAETGSSSGSPNGTGSTGGQGTGNGGTGDDLDFGPFIADMQKRIRKSWFPPPGNESKVITLKFKVSAHGEVSSIRLVKSSGLSIADNAAITAVKNASPFSNLPAGANDPTEVKFNFDYSVFSAGN